jgi:uncharacterized protein (TIGR00304 family)
MNRFHLFSIIFVILGIISFVFGIYFGEVKTGIFIIFPYLIGSGISAFLGFIFLFLAVIIFLFGIVSNYNISSNQDDGIEPKKKTSVKGGGVVLIGPIPIIFGSNWKITLVMIILAIVLIIVWVLASVIINN